MRKTTMIDPRTPELLDAYDNVTKKVAKLRAKQRHQAFWNAVGHRATAPKRSAVSVVQDLLRSTRRRSKR